MQVNHTNRDVEVMVEQETLDPVLVRMIEDEFRSIGTQAEPKTAEEWAAWISAHRASTREWNEALAASAARQKAKRQEAYAAADSLLAEKTAGHKPEGPGARCTICRVLKSNH